MLDSGFMPLVTWGVTTTSKVVDVLLLLGRQNNLVFKDICIVYFTHFS
jgi:hypothetical protein